MSGQLRVWLDGELKEYSELLREFQKRVKKNVPVWMALSVVLLVSFGVLGGGISNLSETLPNILKINLPIGCGIAIFIWFCFWIQEKTTSMEKARKAYEEGVGKFFTNEADQELFCRQMESGNYGVVNFMNTKLEKYPARFMAGPDYWMHMAGNCYCRFIRTADIEKLYGKQETSRVSYSVGGSRVSQNLSVGVSLVIVYKEGSPSAAARKEREETIFFQNGKQYHQAMEVMEAHCPQAGGWA